MYSINKKKRDESLIIYYYDNYLFLMLKWPKLVPVIEGFPEKSERIFCGDLFFIHWPILTKNKRERFKLNLVLHELWAN